MSDRDGEYTSNAMFQFCKENGIIHELTTLYTPESNRVVKEKSITLLDMVNAMLLSSRVPENLWREVLLLVCFILSDFF